MIAFVCYTYLCTYVHSRIDTHVCTYVPHSCKLTNRPNFIITYVAIISKLIIHIHTYTEAQNNVWPQAIQSTTVYIHTYTYDQTNEKPMILFNKSTDII